MQHRGLLFLILQRRQRRRKVEEREREKEKDRSFYRSSSRTVIVPEKWRFYKANLAISPFNFLWESLVIIFVEL